MQQIKPGIYYEDAYLGVTLGALVFSHGTIMIDAPLRQEDARSWRSALVNRRGGTSRLLVSLDAHFDRTLGARAMESTTITHNLTAQVFHNRPTIFKGQSFESGAVWETYDEAIGTSWTTPDITFSQEMILHWGGPEVILRHKPGPAAGSIWVIIPEEEVVFVGDALMPNQPPFLSNADLPAWVEVLDTLINSYRNYTIISGRDGSMTVPDVRAQRRYIKKVIQRLERLEKRDAPPDDTEKLVPSLLSDFTIAPQQKEQFSQRLGIGLYQYYIRHYHPTSPDSGPEETSND
ncbi:MAG: MBL fold metallo-hydrolase [Anaerolineales bacterium]|jgi:glyoxylase-like metal-dependent hydrolase (beta-lactamase superfamily II)